MLLFGLFKTVLFYKSYLITLVFSVLLLLLLSVGVGVLLSPPNNDNTSTKKKTGTATMYKNEYPEWGRNGNSVAMGDGN